MRHLGYANCWYSPRIYPDGWDGLSTGGEYCPPEIVAKCEKLGHTLERVNNRNCTELVICHKCGFTYTIDSSG